MMGLGRNTKINKSALDNKLKQEKKRQDMINRLKKRQEQANLMKVQEAIKQAETQALAEKEPQEVLTDEQLISIFSTGEKYEKTPINKTSNKKKKKKSKK